ncbi:MAG: hypothetical protein IT437_00015 [Phycisphaerales bacterium]|nr:hypothetical protein [Phycisphaerales bacterium]
MKARLALALLLPCGGAAAQVCTPYWTRVGPMINGTVFQAVPFNDGSGLRLYLYGSVISTQSQHSALWPVVRWDGRAFDAPRAGLPPGIDANWVRGLRILDHGAGPEMWVLGMTGIQEHPFARRWDGAVWRDERPYLPTGIPTNVRYTLVAAASFDSGRGFEDYAQGMGLPDRPDVTTVLRWDGQEWVPLGDFPCDGLVGWKTWDDGSGPGLYVMGDFSEVSGVPLDDLARWDGAQWSRLGGGVDIRLPRDMCLFDDGGGEALYVADITEADGRPMDRVAKWDGKEWTSIGNFGPAGSFLEIYRMASFDDGTGPALYVTGLFSSVAGQYTRNLARWDGHQWSRVNVGMGWPVDAMAVYDDGRGPSLFIGAAGGFQTAGGGYSKSLVQYVGCPNCYADCNRDGALTVADFACFQAKFAGRDPYANCNLDLNPGSATNGLNLADFGCFLTKFALGCP